jgi:hypothetical protein
MTDEYETIMKPCPSPKGLTLPDAVRIRGKLMSLLNNATLQYSSGTSNWEGIGGAKNSCCIIRFKNGSGAQVYYECFWEHDLGGRRIYITYYCQERMTVLVQWERHEGGPICLESTEKEFRTIKEALGLDDGTTMSEFFAAIISRSMSVHDFLEEQYNDDEDDEATPAFHQAKKLLPPPVEPGSEMIILVMPERGHEIWLRVKPSTRLSSIAAKYVEIVGNITVEELDFPRVKAIGEDPTVEEMELKEFEFYSILVHHKKK